MTQKHTPGAHIPAKPSEYKELARELRGRGYRLDIGKRIRPSDRERT